MNLFNEKNKSVISFIHFWAVKKKLMEDQGIDPGTSHMQSERSTIWASPPPANSFHQFRQQAQVEWQADKNIYGNISYSLLGC